LKKEEKNSGVKCRKCKNTDVGRLKIARPGVVERKETPRGGRTLKEGGTSPFYLVLGIGASSGGLYTSLLKVGICQGGKGLAKKDCRRKCVKRVGGSHKKGSRRGHSQPSLNAPQKNSKR